MFTSKLRIYCLHLERYLQLTLSHVGNFYIKANLLCKNSFSEIIVILTKILPYILHSLILWESPPNVEGLTGMDMICRSIIKQ